MSFLKSLVDWYMWYTPAARFERAVKLDPEYWHDIGKAVLFQIPLEKRSDFLKWLNNSERLDKYGTSDEERQLLIKEFLSAT